MEVQFLTILSTTPVANDTHKPWLDDNGSRYQLTEDFVVKVIDGTDEQIIVVPEGYVTDMSSIPRLFWFIYPPGSNGARHASVVHDIIYSHYFEHFSKSFADDVFLTIMKQRGAGGFMQKVFFLSVKIGGSGGWEFKLDPSSDKHWKDPHPLPEYIEHKK